MAHLTGRDPDAAAATAAVASGDDDGMAAPRSLRELVAVVREDRAVNFRGPMSPGFYALAVHRFGAWAYSPACPAWLGWGARKAHFAGYTLVRNFFGIELPWSTRVGRRVTVAHQHGIVVHPGAVLGDETVVRHGVTLGGASADPVTLAKEAPRIGKRVTLGAGCAVIGGVRVGDGAVIGPNAVVMTHVPAGARVLAQPPRIVREAEPA